MMNTSDILNEWLNGTGQAEHIRASEGDYIGPEGLLHCGICHEGKEYRLPNGHYVPSLCRCGRKARAEREQREAEVQAMKRVHDLAQYSIIDERLSRATFESSDVRPDTEKAYRVARNYVANWETISKGSELNGLLFYGPNGTGKTWLAACVANALMERRIPVLMTNMLRLAGTKDGVEETIRRMHTARLLVLDDLGAERNTDFRLEQVFNVIDSRYNSGKPMIVTTNMSMDDMKNDGKDVRYTRIWERVRQMCYPVRIDSESWRKVKTNRAIQTVRALLEGHR